MSDLSKAKPKFNFRRDGRWPESTVLAALPTADSAFVMLHPFYRLNAEDYSLIGEEEFQLGCEDLRDAQRVLWGEVAQLAGSLTMSTLRWLIYGLTDGLLLRTSEREMTAFRSTLRSERLLCPSAGAPPLEMQTDCDELIASCTGGGSRELARPDAPGWCRYSTSGDLFLLTLPEEPFTYVAGVRPVVEAAIERGGFEGCLVDSATRFDW